MFEIKNGSFGYEKNKTILSDINLKLGTRAILSILGPNGVGKTTLVKCMLGLLKWTSGETLLYGKPLKSLKKNEIWQKIGYVPQAKLYTFAYTVEEMVLLGRSSHLKMTEMPNKNDRYIAHECLKTLGVLHLKDKLCSCISGGELQMVLIARALATKPSLLILDEPESNLDFRNQLIILNTIKELREQGISSIINTHYPEHAIGISDKALLLKGDGTSICGSTRLVVTEAHLKYAFGVNVKIQNLVFGPFKHTCVLPVSIL